MEGDFFPYLATLPQLGIYDGSYYLTTTGGDAVYMWTAPSLAELSTAPTVRVWTDPDRTRNQQCWAPSFYLLAMPTPAPLADPPPTVEQLLDVLAVLGRSATVTAGFTPPADDTAAAVDRLDAATALLVHVGESAAELRASIGIDQLDDGPASAAAAWTAQ